MDIGLIIFGLGYYGGIGYLIYYFIKKKNINKRKDERNLL